MQEKVKDSTDTYWFTPIMTEAQEQKESPLIQPKVRQRKRLLKSGENTRTGLTRADKINIMTRTIEVLPADGYMNNWMLVFSGRNEKLFFDEKKRAVSRAKREAKYEAGDTGQSVGVKIFRKNGSYQRQHVYEP